MNPGGYEPIPAETEAVARRILNCAFRVHTALGPGLLESVYEACLAYELRSEGSTVKRQLALPVVYKGVRLDAGLRIDLWVDDKVIVELKAIDETKPIHLAQVLTYLRLSDTRLGLLINFNVTHLKRGIERVVL